MKKIIALVLCLGMIASLMAACGGGGSELQAATTGNAVVETVGDDILGDIPKDLTLTIGLPLNSNVEDYDTNAYTLWLEEATGYNLEFITFQSGGTDYKAQLSSMLATQEELPDILYNFVLGAGA